MIPLGVMQAAHNRRRLIIIIIIIKNIYIAPDIKKNTGACIRRGIQYKKRLNYAYDMLKKCVFGVFLKAVKSRISTRSEFHAARPACFPNFVAVVWCDIQRRTYS